MGGVNGFSGINISLEAVVVNGALVTYDGHHAVAQSVFKGSPLFDALARAGLFNGRSWASNGIPLPNTLSGAIQTGSAAHLEGHPAYIEWQRKLFSGFERDFKSKNFGGLPQAEWLEARAADINGFKAFVQTELMKPGSSLALTWRDLDATTYDKLPRLQQKAIKAQFDGINWEHIKESPAFKVGSSLKNGAALFDATPGSGTAFDIKRALSGPALDAAIDAEVVRLKQLTDFINSSPAAKTLAESIKPSELKGFTLQGLQAIVDRYNAGSLTLREFKVGAGTKSPLQWAAAGRTSAVVTGLLVGSVVYMVGADVAQAGEQGSWTKSAAKFGITFSQEQLMGLAAGAAGQFAKDMAVAAATGPVGSMLWQAYQNGEGVVAVVDLWARYLPDNAALQALNDVIQKLDGLDCHDISFMFGPPAGSGQMQPIFVIDPTTGLPKDTTYNKDDIQALTDAMRDGTIDPAVAKNIAADKLAKIGELSRTGALPDNIIGDFAKGVVRGAVSPFSALDVALAQRASTLAPEGGTVDFIVGQRGLYVGERGGALASLDVLLTKAKIDAKIDAGDFSGAADLAKKLGDRLYLSQMPSSGAVSQAEAAKYARETLPFYQLATQLSRAANNPANDGSSGTSGSGDTAGGSGSPPSPDPAAVQQAKDATASSFQCSWNLLSPITLKFALSVVASDVPEVHITNNSVIDGFLAAGLDYDSAKIAAALAVREFERQSKNDPNVTLDGIVGAMLGEVNECYEQQQTAQVNGGQPVALTGLSKLGGPNPTTYSAVTDSAVEGLSSASWQSGSQSIDLSSWSSFDSAGVATWTNTIDFGNAAPGFAGLSVSWTGDGLDVGAMANATQGTSSATRDGYDFNTLSWTGSDGKSLLTIDKVTDTSASAGSAGTAPAGSAADAMIRVTRSQGDGTLNFTDFKFDGATQATGVAANGRVLTDGSTVLITTDGETIFIPQSEATASGAGSTNQASLAGMDADAIGFLKQFRYEDFAAAQQQAPATTSGWDATVTSTPVITGAQIGDVFGSTLGNVLANQVIGGSQLARLSSGTVRSYCARQAMAVDAVVSEAVSGHFRAPKPGNREFSRVPGLALTRLPRSFRRLSPELPTNITGNSAV